MSYNVAPVFDEFLGKVPLASVLTLVVYYSAQILLAIGVLALPNIGND